MAALFGRNTTEPIIEGILMKNKKYSQYSPEELAGALVFPVELTPDQRKEAAKQLALARNKNRGEMPANDRLALGLLQFKFQLEDYLEDKGFDPNKTFGHFLKEYIKLLQKKRKDFASEISIDETMLSHIINMRRTPPDYIPIRLEIHSNNIISAQNWYKLVEKQKENRIKNDQELRRKERKHVNNRISISL